MGRVLIVLLALFVLIGPFALGGAILWLRRRQRRLQAPPEPPPGPALASVATKAAFRLYALRSIWMVPSGMLWTVAIFDLSPWVSMVGFVVSIWGIFCVANCTRVWWYLRSRPWIAHGCRFEIVPGSGPGHPTLILEPERSEEDSALELMGFKWRWQRFSACDGGTVWVAGSPPRGCVVALPGGTHFIWARRPFGRFHRRWLRRAVLSMPPGQPDLRPYAVQLDQPG